VKLNETFDEDLFLGDGKPVPFELIPDAVRLGATLARFDGARATHQGFECSENGSFDP